MQNNEIKIKKRGIYAVIVVLLITMAILFILNLENTGLTIINQDAVKNELEAKFAVLSQSRTNSCGGGKSYVSQLSDDGTRIQGSCCSAMDFHRYVEQIDGLKKYSYLEIIPSDSYDVPSEWAEEILEYNENTILTEEQQEIYDKAVELSYEKGPCCCKCWHWYAYEGLGKKLIIEYDFTSEQVAEVWDLSDACGGSGHIEGVEGH